MMAPTRVFIIDDHPIVRAGLKELLKPFREITVVGEAEDGEPENVAVLAAAVPDVVLLDIRLKRGNGIDVLHEIKRRCPASRVMLLSAFWDDDLVRRALDGGADGYLLKDAEHFDLRKAIQSVAKGEPYFDSAVSGALARRARGGPHEADLADQDVRILRGVAEGMSNKAIGASMFLSHLTVRDRLSKVMAVLGAKNRAEAVQIASRRGFI